MTSIGTMIKRVAGLEGTKDVNAWENGFIGSIVKRTKDGTHTTGLSPNEVEIIERIHNKHFA